MSDKTFKMKYEIISRYLTPRSKRRSGLLIYPAIKFIVAHDTGNPGSTAAGNVNYYENSRNAQSASAHIFVDDKQIIECIPLLTGTPEKAWHVLYNLETDNRMFGFNANDAAAGVEYCYGKQINADEAYARYVWVMAYICFRFNLDVKIAIAGHYFLDPERKTDPVTGLAASRRTWEQLLRDVEAEYNECTGDTPLVSPEIVLQEGTARVCSKLNIRTSKPDTKSPVRNTVLPGTVLSYTGYVTDGQSINGNSKWYRDTNGDFFWAGGIEIILDSRNTQKTGNWWIDALNIPSIWNDYNEQGDRAKVAILDSGYNTKIPDITNGVKDSRICFKSVAGRPITIDDIFGHGSHCASVIGSRNTNGIIGCAPKSEMYIAKICSQGSVRSFEIFVDAITWAIEKKVDIISISYGGESPDPLLESIINKAVNDHNILIIASIGDNYNSASKPCYPALFKNCLAVGATNRQNQISQITVLNQKTEINAPGEDISAYWTDNIPVGQTGTSQASAIVAGIAALVISALRKKGRGYTVNELKELLTQNFDPIQGYPNQKLISPSKIFNTIN